MRTMAGWICVGFLGGFLGGIPTAQAGAPGGSNCDSTGGRCSAAQFVTVPGNSIQTGQVLPDAGAGADFSGVVFADDVCTYAGQCVSAGGGGGGGGPVNAAPMQLIFLFADGGLGGTAFLTTDGASILTGTQQGSGATFSICDATNASCLQMGPDGTGADFASLQAFAGAHLASSVYAFSAPGDFGSDLVMHSQIDGANALIVTVGDGLTQALTLDQAGNLYVLGDMTAANPGTSINLGAPFGAGNAIISSDAGVIYILSDPTAAGGMAIEEVSDYVEIGAIFSSPASFIVPNPIDTGTFGSGQPLAYEDEGSGHFRADGGCVLGIVMGTVTEACFREGGSAQVNVATQLGDAVTAAQVCPGVQPDGGGCASGGGGPLGTPNDSVAIGASDGGVYGTSAFIYQLLGSPIVTVAGGGSQSGNFYAVGGGDGRQYGRYLWGDTASAHTWELSSRPDNHLGLNVGGTMIDVNNSGFGTNIGIIGWNTTGSIDWYPSRLDTDVQLPGQKAYWNMLFMTDGGGGSMSVGWDGIVGDDLFDFYAAGGFVPNTAINQSGEICINESSCSVPLDVQASPDAGMAQIWRNAIGNEVAAVDRFGNASFGGSSDTAPGSGVGLSANGVNALDAVPLQQVASLVNSSISGTRTITYGGANLTSSLSTSNLGGASVWVIGGKISAICYVVTTPGGAGSFSLSSLDGTSGGSCVTPALNCATASNGCFFAADAGITGTGCTTTTGDVTAARIATTSCAATNPIIQTMVTGIY